MNGSFSLYRSVSAFVDSSDHVTLLSFNEIDVILVLLIYRERSENLGTASLETGTGLPVHMVPTPLKFWAPVPYAISPKKSSGAVPKTLVV